MTKPVCAECGVEASEGADGWKAEISEDPEDGEAAETVFYCPTCWDREFRTPRQ